MPIYWYLYLSRYLSVSISNSVNAPLDFTDMNNQFFGNISLQSRLRPHFSTNEKHNGRPKTFKLNVILGLPPAADSVLLKLYTTPLHFCHLDEVPICSPIFSVMWKRLACRMCVSSHFLLLCRRRYSFKRFEGLRLCLREGLLVTALGFRMFCNAILL